MANIPVINASLTKTNTHKQTAAVSLTSKVFNIRMWPIVRVEMIPEDLIICGHHVTFKTLHIYHQSVKHLPEFARGLPLSIFLPEEK